TTVYDLTAKTNNSATMASNNVQSVTSANLLLATSLADNGGATKTLSLGTGSAAIDAGYVTGALTVDQRNYTRTGNPDVGAYETAGMLNVIDPLRIVSVTYPALTAREGVGLTIPTPPNEHPRLFFRKSDISTLTKKETNTLMVANWNGLVNNSNVVTNGKLKTGVIQNLDMAVINAIEAKAFMFAFADNKVLGRAAVDAIFNMHNSLILDYTNGLVSRDIGRVIFSTAIVYDWCYDLLTASEKQYLIAVMESLATNMEIQWPALSQGSVVGHGGEAQLLRDMLACGVATYNEKPQIYNLAAGRIFAELIPARNFFYQSSSHNQGSSYGPYRYLWEMYATLIFDRMGFPNIMDTLQATVPYRWIYTRRPDGQLLRDGDDFMEQYTGFNVYWTQQCQAFTASYYNDAILMGEALKQGQIGSDYLYNFLLINPSQPSSTNLASLALTKYFKEPLGSMVARTGWDNGLTSTAVVAEMKIGCYDFVNHQHLDAGSFQIYYKGPLAVQSGIYQGTTGAYGSAHFLNYYQRTIAHNSMLVYNPAETFNFNGTSVVNDGGQQFPDNGEEPLNLSAVLNNGYKTGEVLAKDFGPDTMSPEYTYIKGELAGAYSSKVNSFKRSFVFLNLKNTDVPAALIVFDRVNSANNNFKKTWLLHCVEEPLIAANVTTVKRSAKGYNGQLVNTTLLPTIDNLTVSKIGGVGNEYSVNGTNYPQSMSSTINSGDSAVWRIEVSPKNPSQYDNFLNVMQVMDYAGGTKQPLAIEKIENSQLVGTKIADRIVLFSQNSELINQPIGLAITGNGSYKVLLTDLQNGTWTVKCTDNPSFQPITIKSDNNLIYFTAGMGNYSISTVLTALNEENTDKSSMNAYGAKGGVELSTLIPESYKIFNTVGQILASGISNPQKEFVPVKGNGVFVVQINRKFIKVLVGD
ncbi:MAG: choice-of-anchor Q domain-containing protein, partial [Paludibacter sp.]|nr:choice-of-anchor Q domain-containing protein [Paludibacter sp.]